MVRRVGRHRGMPGGGVSRYGGALSTLGAGLFLVVISAGLAYDAVQEQAAVVRSCYTQASGVSLITTVAGVDNHYTKSGGYAYVTVDLRVPVGGRVSTVVNVPHTVSYATGQSLVALVDPKDPGYAELPGAPDDPHGDTPVLGAAALGAFALGVVGVVRGLRIRAREGAWRSA